MCQGNDLFISEKIHIRSGDWMRLTVQTPWEWVLQNITILMLMRSEK